MTAQLTEDARRTAILDAAAQLIAERGYHSVRISDIAQVVGTSTGAVHYYFPGKSDVLTAALRHAVDNAFDRQSRELRAIDWAGAEVGDPVGRAEAAGRAWALDDLTGTPGAPRSVEDAASTLTALFAEMGFDPELESEPEEIRIRLHACPFESVARQSPNVVCALHLGLMRGVLARLGAPETDNRLIPWETPQSCVAHLARR